MTQSVRRMLEEDIDLKKDVVTLFREIIRVQTRNLMFLVLCTIVIILTIVIFNNQASKKVYRQIYTERVLLRNERDGARLLQDSIRRERDSLAAERKAYEIMVEKINK